MRRRDNVFTDSTAPTEIGVSRLALLVHAPMGRLIPGWPALASDAVRFNGASHPKYR